ncbi:ExeA family protein [Aestuariivirga sp.]|uniref:ExeA family protein n=1 Tax=Aestuariivirga sp. TaxID=2650926 RepID=UPI0039E5FB32
MYEAHFRLREKPFSMLPDPSFIFWGERYSLAYTMLEYGVMHQAGFTVITGEVGCGKTTLIRHLLAQVSDRLTIGLLSNTQFPPGELMRWVLMAFDQNFDQSSNIGVFRDFQNFLIAQYAKGKQTVLIVDEAQNLSPQALEELRMLSNINADKDSLLQIVLAGQPELRATLQKPELRQFVQRVASEFHVDPLDPADVHHYISHRLQVAGCPIALFSRKASALVAEATGGVPRRINLLCDTALVYGFAKGAQYISSKLLESVLADKQKFGVFRQGEDKIAAGAGVAGS